MTKKTFDIVKSKGFLFIASVVCCALVSSCTPSYPKETLAEAVKDVCKDEYSMEVDVTVRGTTMGLYYPMESLLDAGMGISEGAWDKISNLLLVASRIVLSTDADIKFYCVVTQDVKLPELQVVIIKYVEDVKRSMVRNISRSESFKRTLFSINLTPQAEKERSVEKAFNRLGVDDEIRQKVLDEFFRSPPTKLSDVGYWKGEFYLKDITLAEFLAEQMANRIKTDFRSDKDLSKKFKFINAESIYLPENDKGSFFVTYKIADQETDETQGDLLRDKMKEIIRIGNEVTYGYKFNDFDFLILEDQLENTRFTVSEDDLYNFHQEKPLMEDIVKVIGGQVSNTAL
ncbi:MAG: hypothetical protein P9L90_08080 [Candidatus Aadella gelida]|nr:hypothetical protein [Candidatus Aadella gelida]